MERLGNIRQVHLEFADDILLPEEILQLSGVGLREEIMLEMSKRGWTSC